MWRFEEAGIMCYACMQAKHGLPLTVGTPYTYTFGSHKPMGRIAAHFCYDCACMVLADELEIGDEQWAK